MPGAANLKARARAMRRDPTDAERVMWRLLRDRRLGGAKFRRQVPVGRYIADFLCREHSLIVEVDGAQHANSAYDAERDAWLKAQGWRVFRLWNADVLRETNGVAEALLQVLGEGAFPPSPSHPAAQGGPLPLPPAGEG